MTNDLIIVSAQNRAIGRAEKRAVHEAGLLHRAFSIFLVDRESRVLLQRRHPGKYHSGGLWANSCCGHPQPGERTLGAARRRLREELGVTAALRFGFLARYRAAVSDRLKENEIVYIYFGLVPGNIQPNPTEISSIAMRTLEEIIRETGRKPEAYAFWLRYYLAHHAAQVAQGIDGVLRRTGSKITDQAASIAAAT